jgi:flagellar biogenesis protein FliO
VTVILFQINSISSIIVIVVINDVVVIIIIILFFFFIMFIFHKFGSAVEKVKDLKVVCVCLSCRLSMQANLKWLSDISKLGFRGFCPDT